jgi:DtxR family Mn-dependent transcriptional regulator
LDRLSALGVVPGSRITLVQRTPAFILRVGETELTVDESIAREILTRA